MRNSTLPNGIRKSLGRVLPVLLSLLVLSALQTGGCTPAEPALEIGQADALLSPIIIGSASVFMEITNTGPGADALIGAKLELPSAVAELHAMEDGRMVKTDAIAIPAKEKIRLRPLGHHIMVFRLPKDIKAGETFNLALTFRKSGVKSTTVTVVHAYGAADGRQ